MTETLYCIGCGAKIQTEEADAIGYLPASALEKHETGDDLYCQRCFRLRHYNEIAPVNLTDADFLRLLEDVGQKKALIVNVIDIFDFNGSMIPQLHKLVGKNPVLLVANKRDILPKSLKTLKLKNWLRARAGEAGLEPEDIMVVSSFNPFDIQALMMRIDQLRQGRDVYVVGVTNVGKSTLINAIIKQASGNAETITTSRFPGTTLDKIEIPLDEKSFLVDTPGIIHRGQMAHYLAPEDLKLVSPKKEIKPITFQLNPEQTLFLGGLARFDFVDGPRQGMTCYFENELVIHRTKLIGADDFWQRHRGELLQPIVAQDLIPKRFTINEKSDIVFSGLGWIRVPEHAEITVWVPEGVECVRRRALI
ncbi:MAG: ribosome biogenesis GTPase YqeH [Streptococcaceae bacterium]|jgi:ribosome biogenesis GTPase YqeH|nr:ribosome biogenesis GTPase YqeH [Streptococcaceae bacterium]